MALVLKKIYTGYHWLIYENTDPRAENYIETSVSFLVGFIFLYHSVIRYIGPKLMKERKPFNITNILMIYNVLQILVNVWFMIKHSYIFRKIHHECIPIDFSTNEQSLLELSAVRHFFWLKMFDCLETVFFVLRKSFRQVSFLHLYHHSGMVIALWLATRSYGGGHSLIIGALNTIVHAVMFFYYLLTSIDPSWKKSIAFKRSLTQMQIVQFLYIIFSFGRILITPECPYPKLPCYLVTCQGFFMITLFADFYWKTYISTSKKERK
ncbi:very long chain fatty acid elongase AAEL008004 [Leptinotarsa decemlineata]|uniref:very long chain fatty acid elongase AAEL008004 n=1 Tax=Leptinotarsa decemlineata TaxID=7539 RepID=UPI000C252E02|nr:elongation of very long chain fatty acids protein AAEL008004-like [Leptinotarsa decemlineata]